MPIIPALGLLRQEDSEFEVSLGYKVNPCLKDKQITFKTELQLMPRKFSVVDDWRLVGSVRLVMAL